MYIGLGIFLLVVGLVLALDVITIDLDYVNDGLLGAILIVGGLLAILLSFVWGRRTRPAADAPVVEERRRLQ